MVPALLEVDLHEEGDRGRRGADEHVEGPAHVFTLDSENLSDSAERLAVEVAENERWPAWEPVGRRTGP